MQSKALGKGLSALIPEKLESVQSADLSVLKTELIHFNSVQPRSNYDESRLQELKQSIAEKGILQPILVRERQGKYEVVAGERRLRAAQAIGIEEVPVIIKVMTDQEALVVALIENIQREDLNPIEEAEAYRRLIEDFHYTQDSVANSVGKDRSTISNLLRLLKLPANVRQALYEDKISTGHARALLGVESPLERDRLLKAVMDRDLSVRELESLVRGDRAVSSRKSRKEESLDPETRALQEEVQKRLGTKVRIQSKKTRGEIVIEYYTPDDLDRIIQLLRS